jgi:membrane protease subunit HflK
MSWNKPGGDDKDPWSGRDDQEGPPDLDEAIRSLQRKLGSLLGGGGDGGDNSEGNGNNNLLNSSPLKSLGILAAAAAVLWMATGFYIVDQGKNGVETRFGKYIATTQAGWHWHFPAPIEQVEVINVDKQDSIEIGYRSTVEKHSEGVGVPEEALMLTEDENIIDVRLAVQYQIKNAKDYLFSLSEPIATLRQVTESAERGVIGSNKMDYVLTEGRSQIVSQIKQEIQFAMDNYHSGIQITSVNLQDAQPPEQVQSAFEDAIKAREDKQRLINEAEAYANDVVPRARGSAARKIQEAQGYKEQVIAQAEGEASRFSQLLTEYRKAPEVTRQRLYVEAMESVLSKANTAMIDVKSNNMLYLPLDKMLSSTSTVSSTASEDHTAEAPTVLEPKKATATMPISLHPSLERGREERQRVAREERGR